MNENHQQCRSRRRLSASGPAPYEVLAAIKRGDLPATKLGGRWTITEAALALPGQ